MGKNNYREFIADFTNYLSAIKNLSELYVKGIVQTVYQFLDYMNTYKFDNQFKSVEDICLNDVRTLTNRDVYSYVFYLAKNDYKPNTRAWKIEHLRTFFDFLFRIKHDIFKQPLKKIKTEKRDSKQLPNYLSLNESKSLIKLYSNSKKINEIRNNAIISLCINCGLRVSEVANLNISDFNFSYNSFLIHGKGKKERTGYLNNHSRQALDKYLEIRKDLNPKNKKDNDRLFLSNKKTKIDVSTIRRSIKKAYISIGLDENAYSVHTLRHTCATLLYKSGQDVKLIQEILGHSSINTTKIYTHLYDAEVENTMQEHPLSKFKIKNAMNYSVAI
jgi:site-specific recombinase XerD